MNMIKKYSLRNVGYAIGDHEDLTHLHIEHLK